VRSPAVSRELIYSLLQRVYCPPSSPCGVGRLVRKLRECVCDEKEQKANPHVPLPIFLLFFLFLKKLRRFHLTHGELSVDDVLLFNWSNQIRKPWRSAFSKSA
jgi:hypothetical protein